MGFSIGEILATSLLTLVRRFLPFAVIAVVLWLPVVLAGIVLPVRDVVSGIALGMLLPVVCLTAIASAITFGVIQDLKGLRPTVRECFEAGVRRLPRVLLTAGCMLLVVGPLVWLSDVPGAFLLTGPLRMYFLVIWFVAPAVTVLEPAAGFRALSRSAALTRGHRWGIFAILFGAELLMGMLIMLVLVGPVSPPGPPVPGGGYEPPSTQFVVTWIIRTVLILGIGLYLVVVQSLTYHRLRREKEGADVEDLAEVFE